MKHVLLFTILITLISKSYSQVQIGEGCWHYKYEKYYKVRAYWGGYEQSDASVVSKPFIGEAECQSSANLIKGKVTSNNIYEWIKFRIVEGCSCTFPSLKKTKWGDTKKSAMYHSALTQNTKDWYLNYMMDQINPINSDN